METTDILTSTRRLLNSLRELDKWVDPEELGLGMSNDVLLKPTLFFPLRCLVDKDQG